MSEKTLSERVRVLSFRDSTIALRVLVENLEKKGDLAGLREVEGIIKILELKEEGETK